MVLDVNECANDATHNCSEANNEVCLDTDGSYVCVCKAGFDGEHCRGKAVLYCNSILVRNICLILIIKH